MQALNQFDQLLKDHERAFLRNMVRLARGSETTIRQLDARIREVEREPASDRRSARLAELKQLRSYYENLAAYERPPRK